VTPGAIAGEDGGTLGDLFLREFLAFFCCLAGGYGTDDRNSKHDFECS
jgi:hypothetical protein